MTGMMDFLVSLLTAASMMGSQMALPMPVVETQQVQQTFQIVPVYDPVETPAQPTENSGSVGVFDSFSWYFNRTGNHLPPSAQQKVAIGKYGGYYLGDTQHKVIYLTFDEGYENGYTTQILDTLKENDVRAAFFVTADYIQKNPDLILRMVAEGHVVGNHSDTHPDMSSLSTAEIDGQLQRCADAFTAVTGTEMPKFFRPPMGKYSIHSLQETQNMGYRTIFWSFAYGDWDTSKQPGAETAYQTVMNYYHNGCIMLLHAVSQSNTQALDRILKDLKAQEYQFASLNELP